MLTKLTPYLAQLLPVRDLWYERLKDSELGIDLTRVQLFQSILGSWEISPGFFCFGF